MAAYFRWSESILTMLQGNPAPHCDVLIVGSGYGGSFAARELAGSGVDTWVVERGKEYALGEFPEDIGHLPGHLRVQRGASGKALGNAQALVNVQNFDEVAVLTGSGLGGGSLVNAGVAFKPAAETFDHARWPSVYRPGGARRQALMEALDEAASALGAAPLQGAADLAKFQALSRLGGAMQAGGAQPVHLTISNTKQTNSQGVQMEACIRCGNCFTGCNVGAKGSLATNLIPAAHSRGARFFVGGRALRVQALETPARTANGRSLRWRVHFECSASGRNTPPIGFSIDAHTVIVSAGSLGSTELLLRSFELPRSEALGTSFSTNGDVIAMGWRQHQAVNAVSAPDAGSPAPSHDVGPTICATLRVPLDVDGVRQEILVQDGAIPSALAQASSTLAHTLSTLHRYVHGVDARFPGSDDPLALPRDAARHAQLLLVMGHDASDGKISLRPPSGTSPEDPDDLELNVRWPCDGSRATAGRASYYQAVHRAFNQAHAAGGFDGGDYLPNPLWHPAPDGFADIIAGSQREKSVTVHPLGGCPMGDDGTQGAVDWRGAVFTGRGDEVHAGLHVLDGATVPRALGVNPFVTISALSLLAARDIASDLAQPNQGSAEPAAPVPGPGPLPQPRAADAAQVDAPSSAMRFRIHEHLLGGTHKDHLPEWAQQLLSRHGKALPPGAATQPRAFIAAVEVMIDLHQWLANPSTRWDASLAIYANTVPGWPAIHSDALKGEPLLRGTGQVSLLAFDRAGFLRRAWRWLLAFGTYLARRPGGISRYFTAGWHRKLLALARAGWLHTNYRTLDYRFTLAPQGDAAGHAMQVVAQGRKLLAYRPGARTLWEALTVLDLELQHQGKSPWKIGLRVDLADLVGRLRLQIGELASTPASIVGLASFASLWLRAVMQTHFWSLRGLDYAKFTRPAPPPHPSLKTANGAQVRPKAEVLKVARHAGEPEQIELLLTAYHHPDNARHILLIHGLAHGSGVYATNTVDTSMAGHFLREGYTVWLLDNRMSNRLGHARHAHTMDDIAQTDIPAAIDRVHAQAGGKAIDVFAHCVGAGAFAMAALQARFDTAKVRAAIIHAVHPWVVPSVSNRFSGALAALYRNLLTGNERIDPRPPAKPDAADELLDRFAATLAWSDEERSLHEAHRDSPGAGCAICNRMTAFYGREWVHANLDPRTHERLGELVGVAGVEVFRQLYFIVLRERLTNREGENTYLLEDNFLRNWHFPTLFVHGLDNQVFDPRGAARTWNRLRRVFAQQPARVVRTFIRKGYGHMDFLFGKDAHRDIYPHLTDFLGNPAAFEDIADGCHIDPDLVCPDDQSSDTDLADRDFIAPIRPLTGPMLQTEQERSPQGALRRRLVIWVEQYFDTTSTPMAPEIRIGSTPYNSVQVTAFPGVVAPTEPPALPSTGQGYYWTCVLEESDGLRFADLPPISLTLRCLPQGSGSATASGPGGPAPSDPASESLPVVLDLATLPWWQHWTTDGPARPGVSVLAASCRWPGMAFERRSIDALAGDMEQHITHATAPVEALLLLGDQIYADATANIAETTERDERGAQRYRESWGSAATRQLFARLPVWLVVDDHEFEDNLDGAGSDTADSVRGQRFYHGFLAAAAYQARYHRKELPRLTLAAEGWKVERGLWHAFDVGGIPAFAADTRTERMPRTLGEWKQARIMHDRQMQGIEDWLLAHPTGPKLLCSGSVFALPENRFVAEPATCIAADNWLGYPASWRRLVRFIVANDIQGLIFMAGDYHLSALVEIELASQGKSVAALQLVCSAWNASLPFANANRSDFTFDSPVRAPGSDTDAAMVSSARFASDALRQFSKITITPDPTDHRAVTVTMGIHGPGNVLVRELEARLVVGG
ncbi:MAG: alpha/beta fold hydrolase [Pseudomonadota bacterium]